MGLLAGCVRSCRLAQTDQTALPCIPLQQSCPAHSAPGHPHPTGRRLSEAVAVVLSCACLIFTGFLGQVCSLLAAKLWESPFSALLPISGGTAPTTGMAQGEEWCPQVALQMDSDPAMLSGETLQALWHQKQDRNAAGLSLTSALSHPPAFPVPFFWPQQSLMS